MSAVIGDGEIGVGTLPARTNRSSTGREVSRHLGCIAVEVVPDRALDVGEVGGRVVDGGGGWGGDGEIGGAIDGACGGGDGDFAGGGLKFNILASLGFCLSFFNGRYCFLLFSIIN